MVDLIDVTAPVVGLSHDRDWHGRMGLSTKNYEICLTAAGARIREISPANDTVEDVLATVDAIV